MVVEAAAASNPAVSRAATIAAPAFVLPGLMLPSLMLPSLMLPRLMPLLRARFQDLEPGSTKPRRQSFRCDQMLAALSAYQPG
jgi:hypothetical protein